MGQSFNWTYDVFFVRIRHLRLKELRFEIFSATSNISLHPHPLLSLLHHLLPRQRCGINHALSGGTKTAKEPLATAKRGRNGPEKRSILVPFPTPRQHLWHTECRMTVWKRKASVLQLYLKVHFEKIACSLKCFLLTLTDQLKSLWSVCPYFV